MMAQRPTGTVTFLFTDIEGSTSLWEGHPDEMRGVLARHDDLMHKLITGNSGYVFTTAGDAFSVAFSDPLDALNAAIETQIATRDEPWAVGELRVRMGLHSGVAHERDHDYFGPTLNRAARIMAAGHGGQVLLSQATGNLLSGRLPPGADLRSLGVRRLKDLGTPEHLFQLVHHDLPSEFPELRTLDEHLNNLPIELTSFVGRRHEVEETVGRLEENRLVTLTGVGGAGKTRLALQTATEMLHEFPGGVWVAEMAGLTEAEAFPRWVAQHMGVTRAGTGLGEEGGEKGSIEIVIDYLKPRTALLVLDNCEHLISAAAQFADEVLRNCPNLKILTTSREGLGIRGENLVQVTSLALPSVGSSDGDESGYPEAMELFAERAAAVNSHFVLNDETAPAVAEICRRLDGLPLAIELAAARARMLTAEQISERLWDTFRLLTGGSRTALPRQQTLLAAVDWSYTLLDSQERMVFDRLAVFRGGFDLEAVEVIVSGDGVDEVDVFEIVASLVDKSMVQAVSESGRFSLLETLRQFALGKLADTGSVESLRARHADYYVDVASEAFDATRDRRQSEWFDRLERDHENIHAALTWALESDHLERAARIADGVWWFWNTHGHTATGMAYCEALRAELGKLALDLRVGVLTATSVLEMEAGSWTLSAEAGDQAVELARDLGDDRRLSMALLYRSNIVGHSGDYVRAYEGYEEGYELSKQLGDEWAMGWHMLNKGWLIRMQGKPEESERWLAVATGHFRTLGNPMGLAWALSGLGLARRERGEFDDASRLFREAISLQEEMGNRPAVAFALMSMAIAFHYAGRSEEALEHGERALALLRDLSAPKVQALAFLAGFRRAVGDLGGCLAALEESRPLLDAAPIFSTPLHAEELAALAVTEGRPELAAPLVGYAQGERVRTAYPLSRFLAPDREATVAAIREHVPDWESIEAEWSDRSKDEIIPVIEDVIRKVRTDMTPRASAETPHISAHASQD